MLLAGTLGAPLPGLAADLVGPVAARNGGAALLAGGIAVGAAAAALLWWSLRLPRQQRDRTADRHWRSLLALVDSMVWEADVRQEEGAALRWTFTLLQPSRLYRRVLGDSLPTPALGLWCGLPLPDLPAMNERSRQAIMSGKSGYEQLFPLLAEGTTFWLRETVAIEPVSPGRWHMVGVVTDETARHEADQARRLSDQRVERLTAQTHAMFWQSRVVRRPDGELHWELFLPRSELYRTLFAEDPGNQPLLLWARLGVPEVEAMRVRAREALEGGLPGYEQEFHVPRPEGDIWLREQVSIRPEGDGRWDMFGVVVDISVPRRAEEARRAADAQVKQIMEAANCLLWQGEVRRDSRGELGWNAFTTPSALYKRIFGAAAADGACRLEWPRVVVPEQREINRRVQAALLRGDSGYEQEFRVLVANEVLWLHEQVTIAFVEPGFWRLAGVIVDITARREAEEARRAQQTQLARMLETMDCLLWQARVFAVGHGELRWVLFIPPSRLYREIFGEEPGTPAFFRWERVVDARTYQQLDRAAVRALLAGERGYAQEFRARRDGRPCWLHEQVASEPAGDGQWELVGVITDVTHRHEAEQAEREHKAQLDKIFEVVDCLLWHAQVVEHEDGSLHWLVFVPSSKLFHRLFGPQEPDPRTALNWDEAGVPEYPEMQQRSAAALRAGAPGYEQEFRAFVGGQMYWLFERVSITRVAFNRWELVGVVVDVTARRIAEQEVRNSEQRYHTLFEHTPVAMVEMDFRAVGRWLQDLLGSGVTDPEAYLAAHPRELLLGASRVQVVDCNDMAVRLLHARTKADLQHRRRWLAVPESLAVVRAIFVALAHGHNTYEAETQIRDFSGRRRQMLLRWWIGHSSDGVDLQRSVLVLVDLTELKRAEAELAAEKERLAVTLRAMTEGVVTTDTAGRVQFLNAAAAALTQWDAEAAVGRPVDEVCPLRQADNDGPVAIPLDQVLAGDRVAELPLRTVLAGRDGARRLVEGCAAPIHSAASSVVGMVLVLRDTTERERLEQELQRASKLESVGLLAGGIAHDFNNILTAVMGNLTLALLDVAGTSELGQTLRDAERAALRARDLTQQLLTFAKGGDPVRAAVHLPDMMMEVTRFALHGSRVKAEFDLAPDLWPADADKAQISRVVQNLVINAVQAMPAGGLVRILARNERLHGLDRPPLPPGDYVHLAVSDTGVGIKGEHLERIFEPYFTTKQTGSGLGLATVYSIVRKHKGLIQVESELGRGTTFHVRLPAAAGSGRVEAVVPADGETRTTVHGRILFMDDEAAIRKMATAMLHRLGCEVELVADGQAAVEAFRAARAAGRPFDAVVMDLTVPGGMGGMEALQQMQTIDPAVRAIVSSGYSSDPVLANYRSCGFSGRVAKPYEIADFGRVLREVLGPK
jgi:PAS domain S-box-containing protein